MQSLILKDTELQQCLWPLFGTVGFSSSCSLSKVWASKASSNFILVAEMCEIKHIWISAAADV